MKQFKLFWNNGTSSPVIAAMSIREVMDMFTPAQLENLSFYSTI